MLVALSALRPTPPRGRFRTLRFPPGAPTHAGEAGHPLVGTSPYVTWLTAGVAAFGGLVALAVA